MAEEEYPHTGMINLSEKELRNRKEAILIMLGMTWKEYALKDMLDSLTDSEMEYRNELNGIDFLLGDDND